MVCDYFLCSVHGGPDPLPLGLLLAQARSATVENKAQYLLELRKYLREEHTDVRMNNRLLASAHTFIDSKLGKTATAVARVAGAASGGPKSARGVKEATTTATSTTAKKGPTGRSRKRKLDEVEYDEKDDEEDDTYRPGRRTAR